MPYSVGQRALRKGRRSLTGHYYLLTTGTQNRRQVFQALEAARIVIESLQWLDMKYFIRLDTAVVMPDHLHFIAELKQKSLQAIMKMLKGYTSRKINALFDRSGQLWQSGYYDHAIRKYENLITIRKYCLDNPARAGLARDFHDYPYLFCSNLDDKN